MLRRLHVNKGIALAIATFLCFFLFLGVVNYSQSKKLPEETASLYEHDDMIVEGTIIDTYSTFAKFPNYRYITIQTEDGYTYNIYEKETSHFLTNYKKGDYVGILVEETSTGLKAIGYYGIE